VSNAKEQLNGRGFTLIELLAVVAILALVFGIAVASLPGMTRGSAVRASTAELRATINLARQWAITHREPTYVVFADGEHYSGPDEKVRAGERAFRGYAVVGEESGFVSDWKFLKTGVYFLPNATNPTNPDPPGYTVSKNPFDANGGKRNKEFPKRGRWVPFPEPNETDTIRLPGIGFKPDGGVTAGGSDQEIYIGEGYITVAVGKEDIDAKDLEFKPNSPVVGMFITGVTGGLSVRVYEKE